MKININRNHLRIICPDAHMKAQKIEVRQRQYMCRLNVDTTPVRLPKIICPSIPISITRRGLKLRRFSID